MADGAIKISTRLDNSEISKDIKALEKMCADAEKSIEGISKSLNLKSNPVEIINNSELAKSKKRLEEINAEIERIQRETDKLLPEAATDEQAVNLLKMEESETAKLVEEQQQLTAAISEYETKQKEITAEKKRQIDLTAQEKQHDADIKGINADANASAAGNSILSGIHTAEQYENALARVQERIRQIEAETRKLSAEKGIDPNEALKANSEYQKLKKQLEALNSTTKKFKRTSKDSFDVAKKAASSFGDSIKSALKTMTKYTLAIFGARSAFYAVKSAIRTVLAENEALNNTVTAIKGVFANALEPVIERVVYYIQYAMAYLNLFIKALTGVDLVANYNAKALKKQADATKEAAKATKDANNQLAAFDEKNMLTSNSESSAEAADSTAGAATLDLPDVSKGFDKTCNKIKAAIKDLEKYLSTSFSEEKERFAAVLEDSKALVLDVWDDIKSLGTPLKNWADNDLKEYISTFCHSAANTVLGLWDTVNMVFGDLWNSLVFPCLEKFISVGLPMITQFKTQMLLTWDTLFNSVKEIFDSVWSGAVVPILQFVSKLFGDVVDIMADKWNQYGAPIFDGIREAITNVKDIILGAWNGFIKPCFDIIMAALNEIWDEHLKPLWDNITSFVAELVQAALDIYNKTIAPIVMWLQDKLYPVFVGVFNDIVNFVKPLVNGIIDTINGIVTVLRGVVQFIAGVFTGDWQRAWNGIKTIFKGVWDTFSSIIKTPLNMVIAGFENFINRIISGANRIIEKLNKISISIPGWVPEIGGKSFGIHINPMSMVSIPRLAAGAIVNNPGKGVPVVAGEAGAEAILPLNRNTEWMDVLAQKIGEYISGNGTPIINKFYVDGNEIVSATRERQQSFVFATNGGVL